MQKNFRINFFFFKDFILKLSLLNRIEWKKKRSIIYQVYIRRHQEEFLLETFKISTEANIPDIEHVTWF